MDPVPVSGAPTLHVNDKTGSFPVPEYSEAKKKYILSRRSRMIASRDARDFARDEYDGMSFLKYIDVLKKADDQYIAPRRNKTDTAINTGTIRDKDTTLVEYAQKFDFEPVAQCYDDSDEMLAEMAETAEDLVRKSKFLEDYKAKFKLITRSMVAFGTAYVEDAYIERWTTEKKFGKEFKLGSNTPDWSERKVKSYEGCQAKLWDIRKIYPGDVRKFFQNGAQGQPYFFTVEYETYDVVKSYFEDWAMWKYVPSTLVLTPEAASARDYTAAWTLRPVTLNYVEIIRYYDPIANEYAITLNGIDMLPIKEWEGTENGAPKTFISGFPLTAISPSGAIPFAKYDLEPMHDFFLSKSQPGKMRVWGDIENMTIKLFLRMFKQKSNPTMGNKSGRNFGAEVTDPAEVINDIREGDLFPVLPNFQGLSASDFSFYKMVKDELSKNSVEDSFQGRDGADPTKQTATQNMNDMKAATLQVASLMDGLIFGENQLNWLRTYNIAANWTKPIDAQIDTFKKQIVMKYRTITMPTEIDGGQKATKKIIFTKDTPVREGGKPTVEDSREMHQKEYDAEKKGEGHIRMVHLHPELFAQMRMSWFYSCIPVPNGSDPLAYMMFAKQITDAATFFGADSLNVKKLKHKFASITGNDFDTWFVNEQELEQKRAAAQQVDPAQGDKSMMGEVKDPSIASASRGAVPALGAVMR